MHADAHLLTVMKYDPYMQHSLSHIWHTRSLLAVSLSYTSMDSLLIRSLQHTSRNQAGHSIIFANEPRCETKLQCT